MSDNDQFLRCLFSEDGKITPYIVSEFRMLLKKSKKIDSDTTSYCRRQLCTRQGRINQYVGLRLTLDLLKECSTACIVPEHLSIVHQWSQFKFDVIGTTDNIAYFQARNGEDGFTIYRSYRYNRFCTKINRKLLDQLQN